MLLDAREPQNSVPIGEDTAELFSVIEDSFGVNLGDYGDLSGITIRELAMRITEMASYPPSDRCLSSASFYQLRRALCAVTNIPLKEIRPEASLPTLLPWRARLRSWRALQDNLAPTLPSLRLPGFVLLLFLGVPAVFLVLLRFVWDVHLPTIGFGLAYICAMFAVSWACNPLARSLPATCGTVGGLAQAILARNYSLFARRHGSAHERGVLRSLIHLIAEETDQDPNEIFPANRMPDDLGID